MYKCDICLNIVGSNIRALKKVTKTRYRKYMNKSKLIKNKVKITEGWEIVEELKLCEKCF